MKPIIRNTRFRRFTKPSDIAEAIDSDHRMASVLNAMCFRHPRVFHRRELMNIGGFVAPGDGVTPFTSFHFWMLRINDTLPRTGWRVDDAQGFRLTPISQETEVSLRRRLNGEVPVWTSKGVFLDVSGLPA